MSNKRIEAMVRQARLTGDNASIRKAQAEIDRESKPHHERIRELVRLSRMLNSPITKLTIELVPPGDGYEPVACFDGDCVSCVWEHPETDDIIDFDEWPFDTEYIFSKDAESLGFRVEMV